MTYFDENHNEAYADPLWNRMAQPSDLPDRRIPYQATLRALGSMLDERGAHCINLLEAGDGFAIRYQPQQNNPDSVLLRLGTEDLLSLSAELERKRKRKPFGFGNKAQPDEQGAYENVLRALGYELDQVGAYSILVDEIEDGMVVTYQYLKPSEGFNARKRMVILGAEAMQMVLDSAVARREQRKHGILTLLAG